MAVLLENVTNYVWHAFASLQQDKTGLVHKSKLKVLTANIGTLLDLYGVERGLEHFRSTTTLNFDHLKYYLKREVFASLPEKLSLSELRLYESKIAEICWLICRKRFSATSNVFARESLFQIFRIFCLLADLTADTDECTYQVLLHPAEASYIAQTLVNSLGCKWDEEDFIDLSMSMGHFRLTPFIAVLESRCVNGVRDKDAISEAVMDIYHTFVDDVVKKGYLSRKGYIFPAMKEYWFVLRPSELVYYKSRQEKDKCGSMVIESSSKVETKEGFKIILHTPERTFELGAGNHMTRLQWISALRIAIEHSGGSQSYQRIQAAKRRSQRQGRLQEMLRAKAQLQMERNARQVAEDQAKELEAVVKEESKKLNDLEQIREKLEVLLEEETQAKRDEEIVRGLQARVLTEEWEKRAELERLQEEQKALLEEERRKRVEFEKKQKEKENQLKAAEKMLLQLEEERKKLDEKLRTAHDRIRMSEDEKELLEARLTHVVPSSWRESDGVRRAHSFVPSTKERPVILEIRSATLKRRTKE